MAHPFDFSDFTDGEMIVELRAMAELSRRQAARYDLDVDRFGYAAGARARQTARLLDRVADILLEPKS